MRALSAEERALMMGRYRGWADPNVSAISERLVLRGCFRRETQPGEHEGTRGIWTHYTLTDLGRLALRVASPFPMVTS